MDTIKTWINENKNNKLLNINSCIFLIGNSGIGKTYNVNKLCNELNLFKININCNNCFSSAQFSDLIFKACSSSLIQCLTNNIQKPIIIIDDFDTLLSFDSTINITLLNILANNKNNLKNIPIICISLPYIFNKIGDIKKKCKIIELNNPTEEEIYNIVSIEQNIKINKKRLNDIIHNNNFNIFMILKELKNNIENNNDIIYDFNFIYNNIFDRDIYLKIILTDQWLIPLRFHENLIIELNNRKGNKKVKIDFYKKFIYNFCLFDILMYNNSNIASDYFISIIYDLNNIPLKKKEQHKMLNFTKILSYLSLQKKNIKNLYDINYPIHEIGNYHTNIISRKFIYYN